MHKCCVLVFDTIVHISREHVLCLKHTLFHDEYKKLTHNFNYVVVKYMD
jgi:hypothetical protein